MDYYDTDISTLSSYSSTDTVSVLDVHIETSKWYRARSSKLAVAFLVALILFTDMLVYGSVIPCLPALVIDKFHGTSKDVGVLFGCFALGYLVATPSFAIVSDKYQNRRYPVMFGNLFLIGSTLCFAWANTFTLLVIARVCQGVSAGASWTIGLGMLADTFPVDQLGRTMGTVIMSHTVGFVLGPVLGGMLYDYGGIAAPFYLCSLFALFALLGTLWIAEPIKKTSERPTTETTGLVSKTKQHHHHHEKDKNSKQLLGLLRNPRIISCTVCCFVTSATLSGIEPALPIYLQEKYHVSISTVGVMFIAFVLPSFLGPFTGYMSDKLNNRPLFITCGMLLMAIASVLVGIQVSSIYYMIPSLLMFGLSNPLIHTPLMPEMGTIVSEMGSNAFAQVYALYNMSYSFGMLLGPLISGVIISEPVFKANGFQILMLIFALTILLVACPLMLTCKRR